jgi:Asp-tRNA(Asn)/Glu-tRNA(Gln) amidotransferase A subunit family amidase
MKTAPDATELAGALAAGQHSSVALVGDCLDAIAASTLGAYTHVDRQQSLQLALESDQRRGNGQLRGPLDGLPVAIKGNIAVRDWPHAAGLRFRRDDLAADDAFVVARLRAAGAIPVGLTNMDEGALGAEGLNPWYGVIHNPNRHGYSAGGSSGGSGAAVAANLCALALGTDTIGSVRIPAAFCGCYALKPSYGLVSVSDVVPVHLRFDHVGPMARSARDLGWLLRVLAAQDPACKVSLATPLRAASRGLAGARIGYAIGLEGFQVEPAVLASFALAVDAARRLGAELVPIDLTRWDVPRLRRAILALCEVQMWRVHGERITERPDDYSDGLRAFIRYGGKLNTEEILQAETRIASFHAGWSDSMRSLDAVLVPTTAVRAFPHGERRPQNTADLTAIASATGLPALAMPVWLRGEILPASVQLIGAHGSDLQLVAFAEQLQAELAATY